MFCAACGASNSDTAKFCHSCGGALGNTPVPPLPDQGTMREAPRSQVIDRPRATGKNPVLAAVLSAVIVGVGQF